MDLLTVFTQISLESFQIIIILALAIIGAFVGYAKFFANRGKKQGALETTLQDLCKKLEEHLKHSIEFERENEKAHKELEATVTEMKIHLVYLRMKADPDFKPDL